jgi:multidrug efflux pump subunit AcrB
MKKYLIIMVFVFTLFSAFTTSVIAQEPTLSSENQTPTITIEFDGFPENFENGDFEGEIENIELAAPLAIGGLFAGFGFLMFLVLAISFALFIMWIVMLIHAASKPIPNKTVWILVIVFTGCIGAIVYFFVVKKPFDRGHNVKINVVE